MKYRTLGRSGLRVSCLGLGARGTFGASTSEEEAEEVLSVAYDLGVTLFDAADASARVEKMLGRILRSKGWSPDRGLSRKHLLEGMDPTLRLLRLEELVRAMSDIIDQGLALYWGTAGGVASDVMDTFAVARQLNLVAPVCQWAELPPEPRLFRHLGLGAVTWSPVAPAEEDSPGNSPGKARPRCSVSLAELQPLAQKLGCSESQLGIAWSLRLEGVSSVLIGAQTPRGLREQILALQLLPRLSPAALRDLQPLLGGGAAPP